METSMAWIESRMCLVNQTTHMDFNAILHRVKVYVQWCSKHLALAFKVFDYKEQLVFDIKDGKLSSENCLEIPWYIDIQTKTIMDQVYAI